VIPPFLRHLATCPTCWFATFLGICRHPLYLPRLLVCIVRMP